MAAIQGHSRSLKVVITDTVEQTSSGSESLTGECVAIRFHGGRLTGMQCVRFLWAAVSLSDALVYVILYSC